MGEGEMVRRDSAAVGVVPRTMADARQMCEAMVASGLLPPDIKTSAQAFVMLQTGAELGLAPMQSMRSIHVVKGRPVLSADLMVALCQRSTECLWFQTQESTAERATVATQRRGAPEPARLIYTVEDAQRAGLMSNPTWRKHPAAMLRARAKAHLARDVYPDLVAGIYTPGELDDAQEPPAQVQPKPTRQREPTGDIIDAQVVEGPETASEPEPARGVLSVEDLEDMLTAEGRDPGEILRWCKEDLHRSFPSTDESARRFAAWWPGEGSARFEGWRQSQGAAA